MNHTLTYSCCNDKQVFFIFLFLFWLGLIGLLLTYCCKSKNERFIMYERI